jgi:hypothetical protein
MCACHTTPVARAPATRVPGGVLAASTRDGEATRHLGPGLEGLPRPGKDTSAEVGPPTRGFGPQVRAAVVSCVHARWCVCVRVWVRGCVGVGCMGVAPYAQRVRGTSSWLCVCGLQLWADVGVFGGAIHTTMESNAFWGGWW